MTDLPSPDLRCTGPFSSIHDATSVTFSPGDMLRSAGDVYRVTEGTTAAEVFLQDMSTLQVRSCTTEHMLEALRQEVIVRVSGTTRFNIQLRPEEPKGDEAVIFSAPEWMLSDAAKKVLLAKYHWIKHLRNRGLRVFRPGPELTMVLRDAEHSIGEKCPFGQDTIYRAWRTLQKNQGSARSLLPKFYLRGGPGGHRLDPEAESIIASALEVAARNKEEALQPSRVHLRVQTLIETSNKHRPAADALSIPSVPTVTRRFRERFTAYEIAVHKFGKKRADLIFRENLPRVRASHALDVVQYDDTDTCVYLIDPSTGLPWGRCWLTAGIDEYTGMVVGKDMSESARSGISAIGSIVNGIFPKNHVAAEFQDCVNPWEAYGHHGIVLLDNASYNSSESSEASILEFDSEVEYAPPRKPTEKPDVEGWNHLLKSGFVSNLPGWSGPKEDRELLQDGIGSAVMTVVDFRRSLNRWILDDYSNRPRSTGYSPRELWRQEFAEHPPLMPKRQPSQELLLTEHQTLSFRASGGLLRKSLRYHSDELAQLRKRLGSTAKVSVRSSPHDLSRIFVQDPVTGNYLKVPCSETHYVAGLTDYQQTLILKSCRERKASSPNLAEMVAARDALAEDTRRLANSRKMVERKRAARRVQAGVGKVVESSASKKQASPLQETVVMSDLEVLTARIDEVDLTDEDDC